MKKTFYNFSAGPAMLPKWVLSQVTQDIKNWNNLGVSIFEVSHRIKDFMDLVQESKKNLRQIMKIPENYKILFFSGGARAQFYAIPMNLLHIFKSANYINSGHWSHNAYLEATKLFSPNLLNIRKDSSNRISLLPMKKWKINKEKSFIHYCPNETIEGLAIHEEPNFDSNHTIVADFSSIILSKKINISNYGIIYASSQKNIGPPGITLVIIRKDLIQRCNKTCPSILSYHTMSKTNSMFNTPVTFSLYVASLVFKWIKKIGGISSIEKTNIKKSALLYKTIDESTLYINNINKKNRSNMNVSFFLKDLNLEKIFLKKSKELGLLFLKGHSLFGGMRASIYNAMPLSGVKHLTKFMIDFEKKHA